MFRSVFGASRGLARLPNAVSRPNVHGSFITRSFHAGIPSNSAKQEEPLPPSLMEKYQLNDPTRWVPLTIGGFGLATMTGLYHWNEESQMLALFVVFVGTVYSQAGGAIGKMLDDIIDRDYQEQKEIENVSINSLKAQIESMKKYTTIDTEVQEMLTAMKKLDNDVVTAAPKNFEHRKAAFFANKLERIINYEAEGKEKLNRTLIEKATKHVEAKFQKEDALKKQSLDSALQWLQAPEDKKTDSTQVGDLFKEYFAKVKSDPSSTAEIEKKMKSDLERIVKGEKFEVIDEYAAINATK